jgi:uncharacterized small protein (DUF1192 family)
VEYALKRLNVHLLRVETRRDQLHRRLATDKLYAAYRRDLERQVAILDAECQRYEAELTALLGGGA